MLQVLHKVKASYVLFIKDESTVIFVTVYALIYYGIRDKLYRQYNCLFGIFEHILVGLAHLS